LAPGLLSPGQGWEDRMLLSLFAHHPWRALSCTKGTIPSTPRERNRFHFAH